MATREVRCETKLSSDEASPQEDFGLGVVTRKLKVVYKYWRSDIQGRYRTPAGSQTRQHFTANVYGNTSIIAHVVVDYQLLSHSGDVTNIQHLSHPDIRPTLTYLIQYTI